MSLDDPSPVPPESISPYHARLPYGERVSAEPVADGDFFPFERPLTVVPLARPIVPEPPRNGEPGGGDCWRCVDPDAEVIWRDEHWNLRAGFGRTGLPMVAGLAPNDHMTLHTMPEEVAATLGLVIQRAAKAIGEVPGVARTHINRWGDGSEHFHLWLLARPLGMMQLRGAMIAAWDDMLPQVPDDEMAGNIAIVADAMAAGGGRVIG